MKARSEVLRLLEQLSEKQYNFVVDLIVPVEKYQKFLKIMFFLQVGEILVHCLDLSLLKQRTLPEVFPSIAKFY